MIKLVKEHINEKFTEESDPVFDMGIGVLAQFKDLIPDEDLSKLSINQLLVLGLKKGIVKLSIFALNKGANQLWWQSGGSFGGYHGLTTNLIDDLVIITNITPSWNVTYKSIMHWDYNVKQFKKVNGSTSGSKIFLSKYSPIDKYFFNNIKRINDKSSALLSVLKKLNIDK